MKHILIIEDEFLIAFSLRNYLRRKGYEITLCAIEEKGIIETVKRKQFDLLIMNVQMPNGSDGIEIMEKIRNFSSSPVIYLTTNTDSQVKKRAESTNPVGFIDKPIDHQELDKAIQSCWNDQTNYMAKR